MAMHESFPDEPKLLPETELEAFILFDELQSKLSQSNKVNVWHGNMYRTNFILQEEFPNADIEPVEYSTAVFYNPDKKVTVVIETERSSVDSDAKYALLVEFYRGAPFGFVYDPSNENQFSEQPLHIPHDKSSDRMAQPLQSAYAVWDEASKSYNSINYYSYSKARLDDVQTEDFTSMRIWLNDATTPLDIV